MVAVTESGRAIQAIDASPGDLEFTTPFGVFVCPTDAVERVEDRTLLRNRFLKLLEEEAISRNVLTHEASAAGLLVLMAGHAEILFAEDLDRPGLYLLGGISAVLVAALLRRGQVSPSRCASGPCR